jgi:hypothetical protein
MSLYFIVRTLQKSSTRWRLFGAYWRKHSAYDYNGENENKFIHRETCVVDVTGHSIDAGNPK